MDGPGPRKRAARRKAKKLRPYTVEGGRALMRNGQRFVNITIPRCTVTDAYLGATPTEADALVHIIAALLNGDTLAAARRKAAAR
jgi:hypothetical protein